MFKLFSLFFLCAIGASLGANIKLPESSRPRDLTEFYEDFNDLVDSKAVLTVVINYLTNQEVLTFYAFLLSEQFAELLLEFQSMKEYGEVVDYLGSKGYYFDPITNINNSIKQLTPIESSEMKNDRGITNFIQDLIAVIPIDKFKVLFEKLLENNRYIAEGFNILVSEEFLDILKRMKSNPTFLKSKQTLEGYGLDFKYLCSLYKEVYSKYSTGIFCDE